MVSIGSTHCGFVVVLDINMCLWIIAGEGSHIVIAGVLG